MDIKAPGNAMPPAVPVPYGRPAQIPQRPTPCTEPVSPEDVVDCIEIHNGDSPPLRKSTLTQRTVAKSSPAKGTLIDIRI
jgi:hypothetical protein